MGCKRAERPADWNWLARRASVDQGVGDSLGMIRNSGPMRIMLILASRGLTILALQPDPILVSRLRQGDRDGFTRGLRRAWVTWYTVFSHGLPPDRHCSGCLR